jgi:hypothetical protein
LNQVDFFNEVGNNGGNVKKDIGEFTRVEDTLSSFKATYDLGQHELQLIYGHFNYEVDYREDYDQTEYAWWMTDRIREPVVGHQRCAAAVRRWPLQHREDRIRRSQCLRRGQSAAGRSDTARLDRW